ncbi:hypothetical protein RE628_20420 [Paenibacillus sp. D2_2]|uniref:hypothetical protein n=1 Tax=Paenibacillus sp. D2_2 TaxID=3073092 RepID=UPI0028152D15|nr:hypothetical protein [Paenibacillus sp. D2_2]WMT39736.1 hypothetical protein RE628_20420 [Paenibacillus sp. D2_2]
MYTYISKAIEARQELVLSLVDGSTIAGIPSWGEDRSRVQIKSPDKVVWIPLDEIQHVTTLVSISMKKPTGQ